MTKPHQDKKKSLGKSLRNEKNNDHKLEAKRNLMSEMTIRREEVKARRVKERGVEGNNWANLKSSNMEAR